MNTWSASEKRDIRPPILDFLAYYRDLRKLDEHTPGELYEIIVERDYAPRNGEAGTDPGQVVGRSTKIER